MKNFFNSLKNDNVLRWSFWLTIVAIIGMSLLIGIAYSNLPPFVPLYNHMPWGYARLGHTYELFIPVIVVFIICIANSILGIKILVKFPLLARFLFITMCTLSLFTFFFIGKLILTTL